RTHRGVALRRRAAGPARDEEDRQRGRDPARLQGGRRDGRGGLAAPTPARLCGAAAVRALDSRRRYDDQAALRSSGRGGSRLQSQEAGASEPLLSHVLDGFDASDPRCRCQPRGRACIQTQRAEPLGAARSFAARPVASLVAGRPRLRQRGDHARGGGAGASVSLEAAADRQRQAHDREARLVARMGRRRPGLRGEGERGSAGGLEPPAARDRAQAAPEGRRGASRERRWRSAATAFAEIGEATEEATEIYEYSVLVTSLDEDVEAFGQLYRDRGDGENIFDEMKNQWGWGGYTTHDLARCRL